MQLRAPGLEATRWEALAGQAAALCRNAGAQVLVNGDIALAERLGIGVHLRSNQLHDDRITAVLPALQASGCGIAASCHGVEDLLRAQRMGCDFVVLGPVQRTPTHPEASGIGWDAFAAMREQVSLPIYAIGGMGGDDIAIARAHGCLLYTSIPMLNSLLTSVFGSRNERLLKQLNCIVKKINALEPQMQAPVSYTHLADPFVPNPGMGIAGSLRRGAETAPAVAELPKDDYLDIPAFLRRQAD